MAIGFARSWLGVVLVLALMLGCSERKSGEEKRAEAVPPPAVEPQVEAPVIDESASAAMPGDDDLGWQDALRFVHTACAYFVLEAAYGPATEALAAERVVLARAMGVSDAEAGFGSRLVAAVRKELAPYSQGALGTSVAKLDTALRGVIGELTLAELGRALRELRPTQAPFAQAGAMLELAHGLRALSAGSGANGSPAFGVAHAVVCPDAPWHGQESVFVSLATGQLAPDHAVSSVLQECYGYCAGVEGAETLAEIAVALGSCRRVPFQAAQGLGRELETPQGLLGALAVSETLDAHRRVKEGTTAVDANLLAKVHQNVDAFLQALVLVFDWPTEELGSYPYLATAQKTTSYLLTLGYDGSQFGVWPHKIVRDGRLVDAPRHGKLEGVMAQVELGVPTSLRRILRPELASEVAIVISPKAGVSLLREALRATRSIGIDERVLAVRGEGGRRAWLGIASNPAAVADVLLQESPGWVTLWWEPNGVSVSKIGSLPEQDDEWPGQVWRVPAPEGLLSALPRVHDALGPVGTMRLIIDPADETTIAELLAALHVLDYPRRLGISNGADLVKAETVVGTKNPERRIESVVLTEQRARQAPGLPEMRRAGVGFSAHEIVVTGPFTAEQVATELKPLMGPLALCYDREAADKPGLSGVVTVQLAVEPSGKVSTVSVLANTTESALIQACVEDGLSLQSFKVAPGNAELAVVKVPIYFEPPLAP